MRGRRFVTGAKVKMVDGTPATVEGYEEDLDEDGTRVVRIKVNSRFTVSVRETSLERS